MMQSITLSNGMQYGVENGYGIFARPQGSDRPWQQWTGTCQTPRFTTPAQLRRYLRTHYDIRGCRMIAAQWRA